MRELSNPLKLCKCGKISFSLIQFFCDQERLSSSEMERSARMTWVDFFSSLGGLFGLCLGFSVISFIEVAFFSELCLDIVFFIRVRVVFFMSPWSQITLWPLWTLSWIQCHLFHWGYLSHHRHDHISLIRSFWTLLWYHLFQITWRRPWFLSRVQHHLVHWG